MPPPPRFNSSRAQATAVAVLMAVFLLAATGLAKLQAGDKPAYLNTPMDRVQHMPQADPAGTQQAVQIDTPANWQTTEDQPGSFQAFDPQKPGRRIKLMTLRAGELANPSLAAKQFLEEHLDPADKKTFQPISEPLGVTITDTGLHGVQFIGTSSGAEGEQRLHLLACLTLKERHFWWVYLTDTVEPGESEVQALRANVLMLQRVYRSARIVQD